MKRFAANLSVVCACALTAGVSPPVNSRPVIEAPVGKGKLFLFGPEILNRAQPHGTFKFFFNGITLESADRARVK